MIPLQLDASTAPVLLLGAAVALVAGKFVMEWLGSDDSAGEAASDTTQWVLMGLMIVGGGVAGLLADPVTVVTNAGTIGLGALSLAGVWPLSASQYIGIALAFVGAVLILDERWEVDG